MNRDLIIRPNACIALLLCLLASPGAEAANCNSNGNGSWSVSGTWTCGTVPNNGDVIEIAANTTVTINSNVSYTGAPMQVKVYGTWRFNGGGAKISMPCGSSVLIGFGGQVIGNGSGSSQTIKICNTTYWSASNGAAGGPAAWPAYVLPVELISFSGEAMDDDVELEWTTASEQNSDRFEIFRSRNGMDWQPVASIAAAGSSTHVSNYSYHDAEVGSGTWFFKLLQVDTDGTQNEQGIISVDVRNRPQQLICTSGTAGSSIDAYWPGNRLRSAELYDMSGRQQRLMITAMNEDHITVDRSTLRQQTYVLMVTNAIGERSGCKFVSP